jgi:hypothetical protein
MKLLVAIFTAIALLPAAQAEDRFVVRYDGFGPVRIGMTKVEAAAALGEPLVRTSGAGDFECEYLHPTEHWNGVAFMFSRGRVARVDVREGTTETDSSIRIGDQIAKVTKAYGRKVTITPHQYIPEPEGKYLTVKSSNGKRAIRFETDNGRVVTYYVGRFPEVTFVEGCL